MLGAAAAARPAVGRTGLDQILRGLDRVRERYGGVPGFGSAAGLGRIAVLAAIDDAVAEGALVSSGGARPVLRPPGARAGGAAPAAPVDDGLAARLRDWRSERARNDGVPAYVVLTNACLDEVCRRLPGDEERAARRARTWVPRASSATARTCSTSSAPAPGRGLPGRPCPYDARQ